MCLTGTWPVKARKLIQVTDTKFVRIRAGMSVEIMGIFSKRVGPGYVTIVTCSADQAMNVTAVIYSSDTPAQLEKFKMLPLISSPITASCMQRQ